MDEETQDNSEPGPSLYNFDLMTPDGVDRIVSLLPILDEGIVKAVYQECFPGYPIDNISPRIARVELRGFFMDFLNGAASTNPTDSDDASEDETAAKFEGEGSVATFDDLPAGDEGVGDNQGPESPEGEGEADEADAAPVGDDV